MQHSTSSNISKILFFRACPAGRAFRCKSSPLVPRGCGLSASIPHAATLTYITNIPAKNLCGPSEFRQKKNFEAR